MHIHIHIHILTYVITYVHIYIYIFIYLCLFAHICTFLDQFKGIHETGRIMALSHGSHVLRGETSQESV